MSIGSLQDNNTILLDDIPVLNPVLPWDRRGGNPMLIKCAKVFNLLLPDCAVWCEWPKPVILLLLEPRGAPFSIECLVEGSMLIT